MSMLAVRRTYLPTPRWLFFSAPIHQLQLVVSQDSSPINVIVRRYAKGNVYLSQGKRPFHEIARGKVIKSVLFNWNVVVAGKHLEVIE